MIRTFISGSSNGPGFYKAAVEFRVPPVTTIEGDGLYAPRALTSPDARRYVRRLRILGREDAQRSELAQLGGVAIMEILREPAFDCGSDFAKPVGGRGRLQIQVVIHNGARSVASEHRERRCDSTFAKRSRENSRDVRFIELFTAPIRNLISAQENYKWTLLFASNDFDDVAETIAVQTSAGCEDHRIMLPRLQFVCKLRVRRVGLVIRIDWQELQEMRTHGEH